MQGMPEPHAIQRILDPASNFPASGESGCDRCLERFSKTIKLLCSTDSADDYLQCAEHAAYPSYR
jgi:hypothetical protein